ncbi:hypothetical protein GC194_10985 [bacterium]|nr:hypothetical protein [bacterium]
MNPKVDAYLAEGCMRCAFGGTPKCKVHKWPQELVRLRQIVLECGLTEELKWSMPCYTYQNANILMVHAFKDFAAISFMKGSLLKDEAGLLHQPGEYTQAGRYMKFTNTKQIDAREALIKSYIFEAIENEKAGKKIPERKENDIETPVELTEQLEASPEFKAAFEALTPGRQRGYIFHIMQAKQAATRNSRIEKCKPNIYKGLGWNGK